MIVLESGKFAERWQIAEVYGIEVVRYEVPWGEAFQAADVANCSSSIPTRWPCSPRFRKPAQAWGTTSRRLDVSWGRRRRVVVDGISGAGHGMPHGCLGHRCVGRRFSKAADGPSGLAFLTVSPAAWRQIESICRPAFYFDLLAYRKVIGDPDTPYTPAIGLVAALAECLRLFRAEGIENVWARVKTLAAATRAGMDALGLRLVAKRPADSMTSAYIPEGVDGKRFLKRLESRFGVKLAGGQGHLKGKIFRLAHFGLIDELDILAAIAAIELVLVEMGHGVPLGASVAAASRVLGAAVEHWK